MEFSSQNMSLKKSLESSFMVMSESQIFLKFGWQSDKLIFCFKEEYLKLLYEKNTNMLFELQIRAGVENFVLLIL